MGLHEFHTKRNQVLIYRNIGGLGDMLMHRMVFEDFKKLNPEMDIIFACPPRYFDAVKDHPYIDKLEDSSTVNSQDYVVSYNTTSCCSRYETAVAPLADKHRSDIWAGHCGVELQNHNMHIKLSQEELDYGATEIAKLTDQTSVALCPVSAMPSKNLLDHQIEIAVNHLRKKGLFVFSLHTEPIKSLAKLNVPVLCNRKIREWMGILSATDYVVSVDTAAFHYAGGTGKPVVGIFTWADGYVYGQFYDTKTIVQLHRNTHPDWKCGPCYKWPDCPFTTKPEKPCLTKITAQMIENGIDSMLKIYPICN